jgi:hypothetical protein
VARRPLCPKNVAQVARRTLLSKKMSQRGLGCDHP